MFGAPPDDDPPASHRPPAVGEKREREEGLWQRVREHWWVSMSVDSAGAAWTGKHDQHQGNRISKLSQDPGQESVAPCGSPEFFGQ